MGDRIFHHPGCLDHLGQEHLSRTEADAHLIHAVHEGSFDDPDRIGVGVQGFCHILRQKRIVAVDESVSDPFFQTL